MVHPKSSFRRPIIFTKTGGKSHAENIAVGHSWGHCGTGRSDAQKDVCGGVTTNLGKDVQDKLLSALVAAVAALVCAAIDYLTKEEPKS